MEQNGISKRENMKTWVEKAKTKKGQQKEQQCKNSRHTTSLRVFQV